MMQMLFCNANNNNNNEERKMFSLLRTERKTFTCNRVNLAKDISVVQL